MHLYTVCSMQRNQLPFCGLKSSVDLDANATLLEKKDALGASEKLIDEDNDLVERTPPLAPAYF